MPITVYTKNRSSSPVLTNADEIWDGGGGFFNTKGATEIILAFQKFANTGTATATPRFQWLFEPTNTWVDLEDFGGTVLAGVPTTTGVADTIPRLLIIQNRYPVPGTPTAGVVTFNTTDKAAQLWIPQKMRVAVLHGGTAVSNDWAAQLSINAF